MATRKTERRLPAGVNAADMGQTGGDASAVLVSYHSTPIALGRPQTYVVFVVDASLQPNLASYRWQIGSDTTQTPHGVLEYVPTAEGDIEIRVDLVDGGGATLKSLSLRQTVVPLNRELENLIARTDEVSPVAADPETSRELVNDERVYIDELSPRDADPVSSTNKLLFALAYAEALLLPPSDRAAQLNRMIDALEEGAAASFAEQALAGVGLCQIRPQVLAMYVPATPGGSDWLISRREFPADEDARTEIANQLRTALEQLSEAHRLDLLNLLRFPKTNLRMAKHLLESLMAQYFPGETLPNILADEDKAKTLIRQFKEGPFVLA